MGPLWAFTLLMLGLHELCMREYIRLMEAAYPQNAFPIWLQYVLRTLGNVLILLVGPQGHLSTIIPILFAAPSLLLLVCGLMRKDMMLAAFQAVSGLLYISVAFMLMVFIRSVSLYLPLGIIVLIWVNDTMAYLVGSMIGHTPLSFVSPKKTWEGTVGGGLLTLAGAWLWSQFVHEFPVLFWVMLAVLVAVAGAIGDLFESRLKRLAGVKDSGSLLPGHGGALDRLDSLLGVAPFAFVFIYYFTRWFV